VSLVCWPISASAEPAEDRGGRQCPDHPRAAPGHGSSDAWLGAHRPRPLKEWTRLFRRNFRFTGGLFVNEFLMSLGYLPGAHEPDCRVYGRVLALGPPWPRVSDVVGG
jgi:hypothetical protein